MVIILTFTFEKWSFFGHYLVKIWSFFGHFLGVNLVIILRLRRFRHCKSEGIIVDWNNMFADMEDDEVDSLGIFLSSDGTDEASK